MTDTARRAILAVERGLYNLIYRFDPAFALALEEPPIARVDAASEGVFLVSAPGEEFGVLSQPGRGLVVVAEAAGTLEVVVQSSVPGGSLKAEIELTRVEAPRPVLTAPDASPRSPLPDGASEFFMRAHVSLRGDVAAQRGSWICGPDSPGRIEGFEVRGVSADLPIEYQVATGGRTGGWSTWFSAGTYAGSRGKALPLIGLRMRLKDKVPSHLVLKAEGLFLGAATVTRTGREIELVGPSPLDPMVGFRLDFATVDAKAGEIDDEALASNRASRLRVFRRAPREAAAA